MELKLLPFRSSLERYQRQAEELLEAWTAGDPDAIQLVRTRHPRFPDDRIPWLPKKLPDSENQCGARVTRFDPPVHRATLLHYVAANGVEG